MTDYFQEIRAKLDFKDFYGDYLELNEKRKSKGNYVCFCPFHDDIKKPSLTVNVNNGTFRCLACDVRGDLFHFYERIESVDKRQALIDLGKKCGVEVDAGPKRPPINPNYSKECHEHLLASPNLVKLLFDKKGITEESIEKYELGYDKRINRFTIPIYENDKLVNVRKYSFDKGEKYKIYSHIENMSVEEKEHERKTAKRLNRDPYERWTYGEYRVFGYDEVNRRPGEIVYFCEGEWDKILLSQYGLLVITGTAGANSYHTRYNKAFKDREFVLVHDTDDAGRQGAKKILQHLLDVARSIKDVLLELEKKKNNKDISDYFLNEQNDRMKTIEDFHLEVSNTPVYDQTAVSAPFLDDSDEEIIEVNGLHNLSLAKHIGKKITVEFRINGTVFGNYMAPSAIKLNPKTCKVLDKCEFGDRCLQGMRLSIKDKEYTSSCGTSDTSIEQMMKRKYCPFNQRGIRVDVVETAILQEFPITDHVKTGISITERDAEKSIATSKLATPEYRLYYDGSQKIGMMTYRATGYINAYHKNQMIVLAASELEPIEEDWEKFKLTNKVVGELDKLRNLGWYNVIQDLSEHVTKIHGRGDMVMLMMLSFLSPLYINFNGRKIIGIFNVTVIGDSGTGKSTIYQSLQDFLGIGEYIRGESSGRTGIVWGIKEHPKKGWEIKIGVYIRESRKLLCVDEIQKVGKADVVAFNQGMDNGKIKVEKISSGEFIALTRLICIGNPEGNKLLKEERRPCLSLKGVFEETFIRRIDAFGFCSVDDFDPYETDENDFSIFNKPAKDKKYQKVTEDMLQNLVHLMWNIKSEQIVFEKEATSEALKQSTVIAKKFGGANDLQIVPGHDFRNTLAKASVSFAALDCNFSKDYKTLIVTKKHITQAYTFFDKIYSDPNCALDSYSAECEERNKLTNEEFSTFVEQYNEIAEREKYKPAHTGATAKMIGLLYDNDKITKNEMCDYLNLEASEVTAKIRFLSSFNLIGQERAEYRGRHKFNILVQRLERENVIKREDRIIKREEIDEDIDDDDERFFS